jgi:hypothetical protein
VVAGRPVVAEEGAVGEVGNIVVLTFLQGVIFQLPLSAAEQNEMNPEYEEKMSEPAAASAQAGVFFFAGLI